jgi:hypothetical protein
LTSSGAAEKLTDQLVSIIRQQRHLAARVIVATQEPTLAPRLLDLCNVSIIHRFNSPAWFRVLQEHLAGAQLSSTRGAERLFDLIIALQTGEAFIFCPTAMLDVHHGEVLRMKDGFVQVKIRGRITADGGKSIMASDETRTAESQHEAPNATAMIRPFASSHSALPGQASGFAKKTPATTNHSQSSARVTPSQSVPSQASSSRPGNAFRAGDCLRAEVTKSLLRDPKRLDYNKVRHAAAQAAELPDTFFQEGAWMKTSRVIIREQVVCLALFMKIDRLTNLILGPTHRGLQDWNSQIQLSEATIQAREFANFQSCARGKELTLMSRCE